MAAFLDAGSFGQKPNATGNLAIWSLLEFVSLISLLLDAVTTFIFLGLACTEDVVVFCAKGRLLWITSVGCAAGGGAD